MGPHRALAQTKRSEIGSRKMLCTESQKCQDDRTEPQQIWIGHDRSEYVLLWGSVASFGFSWYLPEFWHHAIGNEAFYLTRMRLSTCPMCQSYLAGMHVAFKNCLMWSFLKQSVHPASVIASFCLFFKSGIGRQPSLHIQQHNWVFNTAMNVKVLHGIITY